MARMIGKTLPAGPGGRRCSCCYPAPGPAREMDRRRAKRGERQEVAREVWEALEDEPLDLTFVMDCEAV